MNISRISTMECNPIKQYSNKSNPHFGNAKFSKVYSAMTDTLALGMGKVLNSDPVIKFAEKFHNTNIADYVFKASGILLSSFVVFKTLKSDKIEENRKKPLALNTAVSCAVATAGGLFVDRIMDKPVNKLINNFKIANPNLKNMEKYVDGIKVMKSALLFGTIYRYIVPVLATVVAEKIVNSKNENSTKKS